MIWSMKVSNLNKIWLRFKQDVDDLIYESIKFKSDLSKMLMIWFVKVLNLSKIWARYLSQMLMIWFVKVSNLS